MSTITIKQPEPGDELVRVVNHFGCDELNVAGKSYRPDHRHAFLVPRRHVDWSLLHVGGFVERDITLQEAIQDVATAVMNVPAGRERNALNAALASLCEEVETAE
jgi:hypothetical protein